jgi:RNA polymerase sigma-70 factor (ECF subfamily)
LDETNIPDGLDYGVTPQAEQELIGNQLHRFVEKFLASLPPQDRQAAFLRFHQGLSYRKIAEIIDVPSGTVKYRVHSIRKQLRSALEKRDEAGKY